MWEALKYSAAGQLARAMPLTQGKHSGKPPSGN